VEAMILAIDPGDTMSGYVEILNGVVIYAGKLDNQEVMRLLIKNAYDRVYIERIVLRGKSGKTLRDTCEWVGRFDSWACAHGNGPVRLITRNQVRARLDCKDDAAVRKHLLGHGWPRLKGDAMQALAVAVVGMELDEEERASETHVFVQRLPVAG